MFKKMAVNNVYVHRASVKESLYPWKHLCRRWMSIQRARSHEFSCSLQYNVIKIHAAEFFVRHRTMLHYHMYFNAQCASICAYW